MKKALSLILAAGIMVIVVTSASAGDCIKIKREYYTPYGKVKVKEYRHPVSYYYPYYHTPAYTPVYYTTSTYSPYYGNHYWSVPSYGYPYPYWGACKVEIDD